MGKNTSPYGNESEAFGLTQRILLNQENITVPHTTGVTLASLLTGTVIPAHAKACEIQSDGGTIRISLKKAVLPLVTTGNRLDDGISRIIDTQLENVSVISQTAGVAATAIVSFFDRL